MFKSFLICMSTLLMSCVAQEGSFSDIYKLPQKELITLQYKNESGYYLAKYHKVKIYGDEMVTQKGYKVRLTADEIKSVNNFIKCYETDEGFKVNHVKGRLEIKYYENSFFSKLWKGERVSSCVTPIIIWAAEKNLYNEDEIDFSTPYWRDQNFGLGVRNDEPVTILEIDE